MSLTSLLAKISGKQQQRERARIDDFRSLVKSIVAGKEPDADHVDAVLTVSGKSLDELQQAVELLQKRKALKGLLDTMPKLDAEEAEINKTISKAREVLDAAERKFHEIADPLRWRREQISEQRIEAMRLPHQLVESCPYGELVDRLHAAVRGFTAAHEERAKLERDLVELQRLIEGHRRRAEDAPTREGRNDYLQRAEFTANRLADAEKSLAEARQRIEQFEKEQELIGDSLSSRWRQLLLRFDHPPIGTRQDVVSVAVFARRFLACSAR